MDVPVKLPHGMGVPGPDLSRAQSAIGEGQFLWHLNLQAGQEVVLRSDVMKATDSPRAVAFLDCSV